MDAFLTTVVAGVIVALVGAFAAYYFGVRQERQKQAYERQKEEEKRREEQEREEQQRREERQREKNKRSAEALHGILEQASAALGVYRTWVERIVLFNRDYNKMADDLSWKELKNLEMKSLKELARQGEDEVGAAVTSFENYYLQQKPFLEPKTRQIIEEFQEQLEEKRSDLSYASDALSDAISDHLSKSQWRENIQAKLEKRSAQKYWNTYDHLTDYFYDRRNEAFEWDYQSYLDALSAEEERIAGAG